MRIAMATRDIFDVSVITKCHTRTVQLFFWNLPDNLDCFLVVSGIRSEFRIYLRQLTLMHRYLRLVGVTGHV